jgi:hypothetical protein
MMMKMISRIRMKSHLLLPPERKLSMPSESRSQRFPRFQRLSVLGLRSPKAERRSRILFQKQLADHQF